MEESNKKIELTKKGKIILGVVIIALIALVACIIFLRGKDVTRLSIEMVSPNEGVIIDDPILGMSTELKVGKKIKLASTIYPKNHKKVKTEYIVENENIAYINDEDMLVGRSAGKTKVYLKTTKGKEIKSNIIEITIFE